MSPRQSIRWAMAAACAAVVAMPLAAGAQMNPYAPPPPPIGPENPPGVMVSTYGPIQPTPGDGGGPAAAQQNVRESREYEALLRSNPKFRARREAMECGSIADPAAHARCLATFDGE